jgi:hypothetical protein
MIVFLTILVMRKKNLPEDAMKDSTVVGDVTRHVES